MMNSRPIFGVISFIVFLVSGVHLTTITTINNCSYTIWPATLTGGSSYQLIKTGFELTSNASNSVDIPSPWSGRFWARTHCSTDSSGKFICATGDCGTGQVTCNGNGGAPPASLVEFTIAMNNGQDFYDLSLVDGFNLPVSVTPLGGNGTNCTTASCAADVNAVCPRELQVKADGSVVGCKSACSGLNQPEYCCTGAFNTSETCPPSKYSMIFKGQCPQAYSYAYDDTTSLFSCTGGVNYVITFCP